MSLRKRNGLAVLLRVVILLLGWVGILPLKTIKPEPEEA